MRRFAFTFVPTVMLFGLVLGCKLAAQTPNYRFTAPPTSAAITRVSGPISGRLVAELAETVEAARNNQGRILCLSVQRTPHDHILQTCRLNGWFYQHLPVGSCVERHGRRFCYHQAGNYLYESDGQHWQSVGRLNNPATVLRAESAPHYLFH